jgi:integrase
MISVKYSLRDKQAKKRSTIRSCVSYSGNRIVFCPGYSIIPDHWDYKTGLPKSTRGSIEIKTMTTNLKDLDVKIRMMYDDLSLNGRQNVSVDVFKQKILNIVHPEKYTGEDIHQTTLLDFTKVFIKDCENGTRLKDNQYQLEESTIKPYRTTRDHLSDFQKMRKRKILLTDINQDLHDEFSNYLIEDLNLSKNAHSKYIMVFSQIVKYAVKKKLIPSSILNEMEFNTRREDSDNIYLNEQELQLFMDLKVFKSKMKEEVRDLFIVGCYTGLRFSNYSHLDLEYMQDGNLTIIQKKTKQKVTIPIHPNVKMIIDKYKGVLPPCPTSQEFNRTLKELGEGIPELNVPFSQQITKGRKKEVIVTMKWEKIVTHTARRSFCTNMYLMGVPVVTIMSISGHKTQKSFMGYIKATGEEHATIMKEYWDNNEEKKTKNEEEENDN